MKKELGTLYPSLKEIKPDSKGRKRGTMFMSMSAGKATIGKKKYDLSAALPVYSMVVRSEQTGRQFTISWTELIQIAIERGIDSKSPIPNPADEREEKISPTMKKMRKHLEKIQKRRGA